MRARIKPPSIILTPKEQLWALRSNLNSEFKLLAAIWILLMQAGFAFLEAGSVRSKNTTNILFKNFLDMFVGAFIYWSFGFAFTYGEPGNAFIGHGNFFASNENIKLGVFNAGNGTSIDAAEAYSNAVEVDQFFASFVLSYSYAAAASTITSGAMAERVRTSSYLMISALITGFIYPTVAHWIWSRDGWLHYNLGLTFIDHAGSAAVHVTGGVCALVGTVILGPRAGRFPEDFRKVPIRGHSIPMTSLGGFLLFSGFLAFNAASQEDIFADNDYGAGTALTVTNTVISGSTGAFSAMVVSSTIDHCCGIRKYWSLLTLLSGFLGGLVAVCAGSNQMAPWASVLTGLIGGASVAVWKKLLLRWKIDDPVDAVPVHLGAGLAGVLTAPIWVYDGQKNGDDSYVGGLAYGGGVLALRGFGWNMLGTVCILLWSGCLSAALFLILRRLKILRITAAQEVKGLDLVYHGEPAYPKSKSLPIRNMINYDF